MICPLCRQRKARRACPALGHDICAVCCGTKRLVEIRCVPTCVYLETAQRHPAAVVRKQQEHDLGALMTTLGRVSERQLELFFVIQTFIARFTPAAGVAAGLGQVLDADVAEAAGSLAASFETAARGVLYEHQANSVVAEALRRELKTFLTEVGRGGGSRFEREAAEVLRGIERGARHEGGIGAGSRDYLTLIARILKEHPPDAPPEPSIIIP